MPRLTLVISVLALCVLATEPSQAKLNVVASTPDLGSIAREVGGDRVEVIVLARGTEDPHFVDPKSSFTRLLHQADVLIEGGADLEVGWLSPLILSAKNGKIQPGRPGRITAAEVIKLLEVPADGVDRSPGDVHPFGNPHFTLDPFNGKLIAHLIAQHFCTLMPDDCEALTANLKRFDDRIDARVAIWQKQLAPYRGIKVLSYHKSYNYFAERFGLRVVNAIEPKPGSPPSDAHVRDLVAQIKAEGVGLILIEPNRERKTPAFLARETGAKVVLIPSMVGGTKEAADYSALFDSIVKTILKTVGQTQP